MQKSKAKLVEKRNILNELISRKFDLQELRLFSIYLSKINAREISTRVVRLELRQFYKIMDISRQSDKYLREKTNDLLTKIVNVPDENNSRNYTAFQLFKKCRIATDENGKRYFEIDAHDDALPLMFVYKGKYFKYELWNVLNLDSVNKFRMYEILKENEWRGEFIIAVEELKTLLGMDKKEYSSYNDFKKKVINVCQKSLKEKTDISFTYETHSRGDAGKILSLRFTITKNDSYTNQLNLEEFVGTQVMENARREAESKPETELDISGLKFITEKLTERDKLFILQAADGDIASVKIVYDMAKQQGGINDLVPWLIAMVKKLKNGEISQPINVIKEHRNRFCNFEERVYDYAELERLENERLMASITVDEA